MVAGGGKHAWVGPPTARCASRVPPGTTCSSTPSGGCETGCVRPPGAAGDGANPPGMLIMSPVTSATSDTAPPPSHSEAVRYGWPLPRRHGAYLTGTVGPDRLGKLDATRGLALLRIIAH